MSDSLDLHLKTDGLTTTQLQQLFLERIDFRRWQLPGTSAGLGDDHNWALSGR